MLLAVFCLRLALGMLACLLLLRPDLGGAPRPASPTTDRVQPGFWRTHFLVALGLLSLAAVWLGGEAPAGLLALLIAGAGLAFAGSVVWSLERAPLGRTLIVLTCLACAGGLVGMEMLHAPTMAGEAPVPVWLNLLGDATAAGLLGAAVTAMLLGHSYLISPTLSVRPLLRMVAVLAVAVTLRMAVDGYGLWAYTASRPLAASGADALLWLPVRWGMGLVGPLVLCGLAWQTTRIRSTQSATGILYVVVIFCFLGELTGQLLRPAGLSL
jgi:hypothetical protein